MSIDTAIPTCDYLARRAAWLAVQAEQVEGTDAAEWSALNREAEHARQVLQDVIRDQQADEYPMLPSPELEDVVVKVTGRALSQAYTSVRAEVTR